MLRDARAGFDPWADPDQHELWSATSAAIPAASPARLALVNASQAVFEVTTLRDVVDASDGVLSLREAILEANAKPGLDTITFADDLRGGTIKLTADLPTITDDLVIDGDPLDRGAGGIVIDGDYGFKGFLYGYRPFDIDSAVVRFEDLTIQNSFEAGISASSADITLERVAVDRAVYSPVTSFGMRGDGSLAIVDSAISRISSESAFAVRFDGDVTIERSIISGISGDYGAAVQVTGDVRLVDSTFTGNLGSRHESVLIVRFARTIQELTRRAWTASFGADADL